MEAPHGLLRPHRPPLRAFAAPSGAIFPRLAAAADREFDRHTNRDRQNRPALHARWPPWPWSTKAIRWWSYEPPELSHRLATLLVSQLSGDLSARCFALLARLCRQFRRIPSLYAALLGAIHFLLFVMLVRLYSATTDRDAFFLAILAFAAILAAAILTIDTFFLIMFFIFLLFGVATFVGLELRRGGRGATTQAIIHPLQERRLARALTWAALSVALGRYHDRRHAVLFLSAIQRGISGPHRHATIADERIQRRRRTRPDRRDQKEPRGRDARQNRLAGRLCEIAMARDRAHDI